MEYLIEQLTSNPVLLAAAVVLVILIVYAVFKRLLKLAIFVAFLLILAGGFSSEMGCDF